MIKFQGKHKSGFTVDLPVSPFTFPAGEAHIKGLDALDVTDYDYFITDIRGHNPQDLFHATLFVDGVSELDFEAGVSSEHYLLLPYLPAARADRGTPFGARTYASFINSLDYDAVFYIDPHSPVMPENLVGPIEYPFERIIKQHIQDGSSDSKPQPYVGVIAPDKGAVGRATRAATVMGVPVYTAGKTRYFETGQLTGFHMEDELPKEGKFLLVDDICDGGGTFIGLAEAIKETNPDVKLDLWVTHGVFSKGEKGLKDLTDRFDVIHTTNSYADTSLVQWSSPGLERRLRTGLIKVHDITPHLYSEVVRVDAGRN